QRWATRLHVDRKGQGYCPRIRQQHADKKSVRRIRTSSERRIDGTSGYRWYRGHWRGLSRPISSGWGLKTATHCIAPRNRPQTPASLLAIAHSVYCAGGGADAVF